MILMFQIDIASIKLNSLYMKLDVDFIIVDFIYTFENNTLK